MKEDNEKRVRQKIPEKRTDFNEGALSSDSSPGRILTKAEIMNTSIENRFRRGIHLAPPLPYINKEETRILFSQETTYEKPR